MIVRWIAALLLLAAASRPASAQSLLLTQENIDYAAVEFLKYDFHGDANSGFFTMTAFATLRYKVQPALALVVEVPYARYDPKSYGDPESTVGDLYLGLEQRSGRDGPSFEFGVRLPTTSEDKVDAAVLGILSDVNRWEAFLPKTFAVVPGVNYRYLGPNDVGIRVRAAASMDVPTGDNNGDTEIYGLYAIQFVYMGAGAEGSVGLSGRIWVTEGDLDIGQRTVHQLDAAVNLAGMKVRPGAHLRIPLDEDFGDLIDATFGVQLMVVLE